MQLPRTILWARVLLFVLAGVWAAMAAGTFLMLGRNAFAFGYAMAELLPAGVFFLLGLLIRRNGPVMFWSILSATVIYLLYALLVVLNGGWATQLVLPAALIVLLLRKSSRRFFLQE